MSKQTETQTKPESSIQRNPGVCIPWEEEVKALPPILGDEKLVRKVWEDVDGLGYMYIWHLLVSS